jgi:signal transduction histidine kinase
LIVEILTHFDQHAEASSIEVTIEFQDENLVVSIRDDGKGFDPSKEENNLSGEHVGLRSIKERARILRGNIIIESKSGAGTTVNLALPLKA